MNLRSCVPFALISLGAWQIAQAEPFTAEHLVRLDRVGSPAVSPAGDRVAYAVRKTDMDAGKGRYDLWISELSGGQPQRVGIARSIVAHPKVVVADEPTGSLDAETSQQIQVLLQRLNRELNITMLMVTHDRDVANIASRQLILDRGKFLEPATALA